MAANHPSMESRIDRLEKQNRVLIVALLGVALVGLTAATAPRGPLTADTFQLTDQNGRVRAELGFRDGTVGLFLKDEEGKDRLSATHDSQGTSLYIRDTEGTTRIGVAQFAHGGGGFALHGPESKGAAVLYLKGAGSLRFFDSDGKVTNQVLAAAGRDDEGK